MMEKVERFLNEKFIPGTQKMVSNPYMSGIQKAILKVVPMILVSSIITIYNIIKDYVPGLPVLDAISSYSFGLMGLMVAFLIPYYILEEKNDTRKIVGGMTGLAAFFLVMNPVTIEEGVVFNFDNFGAAGMFVAMICGLFIVFVFNLTTKLTFFGEDTPIPDFVKEWFSSIIPIFVILLIGSVITNNLNINLFDVIVSLFAPVVKATNTYWGGFFIIFLPTFVYTFGISCWVFDGIILPITNAALVANAAAYAAGETLPYVYCYGFDFAYIIYGGVGVTLPLVVYFLLSKSKRLKLLGKVYIIPTILNINEPVMYGNIVWNPILMIPSWLCTIVNYSIAYFVVKVGIMHAPVTSFGLWFAPSVIPAYVLGGLVGAVLCILLIALDFGIWYPFFKAYEKNILKEENEVHVNV